MDASKFDTVVPHIRDSDVDADGRLVYANPDGTPAMYKKAFVMIRMPGCGPCEMSKPEFMEFAARAHCSVKRNGQIYDSPDCIVASISVADKAAANAFNAMQRALKRDGIEFRGFPTFVKFENGTYSEHAGPRSAAAFYETLHK